MSAEKALLNAYSEWHRLAKAAGKAIRLGDWNFLLECQGVIKKLQPDITKLTHETRAEWKQSGIDSTIKEKNISSIVSELMALGKQNKLLIQAAREKAQSKRLQLVQSSQNLKRLQKSYANVRMTAWTLFS